MNRKWMVAAWVAVLGISIVLAGCPKKKPAPAPEPEIETTGTTVPPATEVEEPAAPPPVDDTPSPLDADLVSAQEYAVQNGLLGDVFFDFDKYDLRPEARERLDKNAAFMREYPRFVLTIEGHCDERGTNEYNLALGERRANTAKSYLESLGIAAARLRTISYGEERPFCTESNEGCWQRNRRGHFVITGRADG